MSISNIIMFITVFILVAVCIYLIYLLVSTQTRFIDPKKCPQQVAEFGVTPQTAGNVILNVCGTNSSQPCTFSNVANLAAAINICHQYANACTVFSYAPGILVTSDGTVQGVMNIVSPTGGVSTSTTYDTYTQQVLSTLATTS